jgi:tRNA dimethylallyltransferase
MVDAASSLPDRVVFVTGPTAAGKTELAIALAEACDAEIVGADSRQVYRRMDAGTAKPSHAQRQRAVHHMIDIVDPDDGFDVATWREGALQALGDIRARGHNAIVCGGTGLYLRSLAHGLFDGPEADVGLRARLEQQEVSEPGSLYRRLIAVDPTAAERIHANDIVRCVRALEVLELTGEPISAWQRRHRLAERPFETLTLEVTLDGVELAARIERRAGEIVEAGLLDELAGLRAEGYPAGLKAFDAIGYREAGQCLDGRLAAADLVDAISRATRRYAKRQRVWNRGQMTATPVHPEDCSAALARVRGFLHGMEPGDRTG